MLEKGIPHDAIFPLRFGNQRIEVKINMSLHAVYMRKKRKITIMFLTLLDCSINVLLELPTGISQGGEEVLSLYVLVFQGL